jgi:hypothetical protein
MEITDASRIPEAIGHSVDQVGVEWPNHGFRLARYPLAGESSKRWESLRIGLTVPMWTRPSMIWAGERAEERLVGGSSPIGVNESMEVYGTFVLCHGPRVG